jgi:alpha-beta hydrolase superfamily lysophospholipase
MQHKEGTFKGYKDYKIYYQCWLPEGKGKAVLFIAHGFAEHSGRYGNVVNHFVPKGYAVWALDHRGHGRSDGERVQVDDSSDYTRDMKTFFDLVRKENPGKQIFLIGHSMGSMIALNYAFEYQRELAGLVTSGGGISRPGEPPPAARPAGQPLDTTFLSRDPAVISAYVNDPLVYRGPMPQRSGMTNLRTRLTEMAPKITLPALIMAGNDVPDGERSQALYEFIGSKDKTLKRYNGLRHEIFNEPEYPQVMADLEKWLEAHIK